ncbi:MAG: LysM peptidoglycan-binding domain-containing protein [Desulforudis sp.]|jgi:LysM repeat protein|nr:MAG: LysM peptidoglycan-binding domain-containing protein [Desulforudis sp.]
MQYTVERGDTLFGICRRFGVQMQDVLRLNGQIRDPHIIVEEARKELKWGG